MNKKTGIIGAMEIEVELLKARMSDVKTTDCAGLAFFEGNLGGKQVVVVRSGIGKVNAALCAQRLVIQFGVTQIINTGIAGAMAHGLGVLDMVVSTDAVYHDFDVTGFGYKPTIIPQMKTSVFTADAALVKAAEAAFAELCKSDAADFGGHRLVAGRIASGDQFISSREQKNHIRGLCDPACVEMEGAAIAHACYLNEVPFIIIRCISDMADDGEEATYKFNDKTAAAMSAALVESVVARV